MNVRSWAQRTSALRAELAQLADVSAPYWWLVAAGAAVEWNDRAVYVASDAEPATDTFIGHRSAAHDDLVVESIARAHAARATLRRLDRALPDQPLVLTLARSQSGAIAEPSELRVAAFAIGDRCWCAPLADRVELEDALATDLRTLLAGGTPTLLRPRAQSETPFVCVALGDESIETARHTHRRAWHGTDGTERGPWLGLGRSGDLSTVSTCHMVVDGYGHAWLAGRIAALAEDLRERLAPGPAVSPPALPPHRDAIPLTVAWREVPTGTKALPLAYALGQILYRAAADPRARFSPAFQIPIAPGAVDDLHRPRRRVIPAIASLRFDNGTPEPFDSFAARTKATLAREATGDGLMTRLLATARAMPVPVGWKRRAITARRPRWLEPVAAVMGNRGCVSRIELAHESPPACAVSSPGEMATSRDPLGSCVITVIDDGVRAAITLCGSGSLGAASTLDEILSRVPR